MTKQEDIRNIASLTEEAAVKTINVLVEGLNYDQRLDWYRLYNDYLNDRGAFERVDCLKYYSGDVDGYFPIGVKARLQLLSYYTLHGD